MTTIPYSRDAERALVGAVVLTPAGLPDVLDMVQPGDLYGQRERRLLEAVTALVERGDPVDDVTVAAEAGVERRGVAELLLDCPASANAVYYARKVAEMAQRRRMQAVGSRLMQAAGEDDPAVFEEARILLEETLTGLEARTADGTGPGFTDGASFILDIPAGVPSVWGDGEQVAWAAGEPLLICGPPGAGKSTIAGQLVLARLGLVPKVLGLPVAVDGRRVLYVAADRPAQIARSFARMVREEHREVLAEELVVWRGPLPHDLASRPRTLIDMARRAGAGLVVLDSLKDVAVDLTKDETGSRLNLAFQMTVAAGVELVGLHHQRKAQQGAGKPKSLADVYGSTWITAGAGSVLLVWGDAGDPVVELTHLKQPAADIGPLKVLHDHDNGTSTPLDKVDAFTLMKAAPDGVTAVDVAIRLFGVPNPDRNQIEKARRQCESLHRRGLAAKIPGRKGGSDGGEQSRYYLTTIREERS